MGNVPIFVAGHDPGSPILYDAGALTGDSSAGPTCQRLITPVDNMLVLRLDGHTDINVGKSDTGNGTTSGGSGYLIQTTAGDSDLAWFDPSRAEEFRTVTLGIRPAP